MFKKDSFIFGFIIGIVVPTIAFGILQLVNYLLISHLNTQPIQDRTVFLISVFTNLVPIRIYFVNLKKDKTGRAVLLLTFVLMIIFFILERTQNI